MSSNRPILRAHDSDVAFVVDDEEEEKCRCGVVKDGLKAVVLCELKLINSSSQASRRDLFPIIAILIMLYVVVERGTKWTS